MTMNDRKPSFLVTIDTEGDNLWSRPANITTDNANYLPRFQKLCEQFGFKPTYLTNYEMASNPSFQEFGSDIIQRNAGEIGMHLHAWNSPPELQLTEDDAFHHPYLIEYPPDVIREKCQYITQLLESIFNVKMYSHRAGRWGFNETYAQILIELGYIVDCSVTPGISWKEQIGDPRKLGGSNYKHFPTQAYFIDPSDIKNSGSSSLLEVPMTTMKNIGGFFKRTLRKVAGVTNVTSKIFENLSPQVLWFRPGRNNLKSMRVILQRNLSSNIGYIELMLHSSELMPGANPTFKTKQDIEKLYKDLEIIFTDATGYYVGKTLFEYSQEFSH